ncbi:hypothetical protein [Paucibacter sp. DJ2R-2]|uniref:hypothetical protein n=1 Tax=Paucibacter sp. DJ2R-2 TaxID=2893558 RepID=UPI0021E3CD9C|nr:hypothetical protein [Paucibacter sp. DJ2R-2]MCV2419609.1 hypothetical protein [Paucibacter sp. DJ4R-1]MCV2437487.1 hypothetical protein [Paucibacter sp. DJ2R-2]
MKYPAKTEAGREALRLRDPALNARDRQILVLANGERALQELAGMVGVGGAAAMERLAGLGFLTLTRPAAPALSPPPRPSPNPTPPTAAAVAPAQVSAQAERRSSAAAKMYIVDVLQMIRGPEAQALAALVHTSGTEEELMEALDQVLERLAVLTRPRYALRVCQHLQTVLPHSALLRLAACAHSLADQVEAEEQREEASAAT